MNNITGLNKARHEATHRELRRIELPKDEKLKFLKIEKYFGEYVFDIRRSEEIPQLMRQEMCDLLDKGKGLERKHLEMVAVAVTSWAQKKGATHFCHWFLPLTGSTAEKQEAMISFDANRQLLQKLTVDQLLQGEPDASSFPSGGSRSTFEARGYTTWDVTSPMFLTKGQNGKVLCIPTVFVSYNGDALDTKTPLIKSSKRIDKAATEFMQLTKVSGVDWVKVSVGPEQEYFLVDKALYNLRPDLVMTGRALFGNTPVKNQQLEDHYFGTVSDRILAFMQELDFELYRLGIPSKARHNEVAPGQFEVAPIFEEANIAADHNQLVMAQIKKIAEKHSLVALMHEKPFQKINGSGKHVNWSMYDNRGENLLSAGETALDNYRFLAMVAIVIEAVFRHAKLLRIAVASHSNDHRLGANEAPPSIISVYVGETLQKMFDAILKGEEIFSLGKSSLDIGVEELSYLMQDNSDRNRTSPFAFTGNRFEFRAVGSSQGVGFPVTILNAAVADVLQDSNQILKEKLNSGESVESALIFLIQKWIQSSKAVIFNGDGYSSSWHEEALKRGLDNLKTTPDAIKFLTDKTVCDVLLKQGIFKDSELKARAHVLIERYNKYLEIEIDTLNMMINRYLVPAAEQELSLLLKLKKEVGDQVDEKNLFANKSGQLYGIYKEIISGQRKIKEEMEKLNGSDLKKAVDYANIILPKVEMLVQKINSLEQVISASNWPIPSSYDLLYLK